MAAPMPNAAPLPVSAPMAAPLPGGAAPVPTAAPLPGSAAPLPRAAPIPTAAPLPEHGLMTEDKERVRILPRRTSIGLLPPVTDENDSLSKSDIGGYSMENTMDNEDKIYLKSLAKSLSIVTSDGLKETPSNSPLNSPIAIDNYTKQKQKHQRQSSQSNTIQYSFSTALSPLSSPTTNTTTKKKNNKKNIKRTKKRKSKKKRRSLSNHRSPIHKIYDDEVSDSEDDTANIVEHDAMLKPISDLNLSNTNINLDDNNNGIEDKNAKFEAISDEEEDDDDLMFDIDDDDHEDDKVTYDWSAIKLNIFISSCCVYIKFVKYFVNRDKSITSDFKQPKKERKILGQISRVSFGTRREYITYGRKKAAVSTNKVKSVDSYTKKRKDKKRADMVERRQMVQDTKKSVKTHNKLIKSRSTKLVKMIPKSKSKKKKKGKKKTQHGLPSMRRDEDEEKQEKLSITQGLKEVTKDKEKDKEKVVLESGKKREKDKEKQKKKMIYMTKSETIDVGIKDLKNNIDEMWTEIESGIEKQKQLIAQKLREDGMRERKKLQDCTVENMVYILREIVMKNKSSKWYGYKKLVIRYFIENKIDGKKFMMLVKDNNKIVKILRNYINPNNMKLDKLLSELVKEIVNLDFMTIQLLF